MSTAVWRNWSGTQTCRPERTLRPATEEAVAAAVAEAAAAGGVVRPLGAGHSFTPVACTGGLRLQLDELSGLVAVDHAAGTVTLRAGTRLRDIPGLLRPLGLALPNQGDVDPQSVAGAVSTGTHGTGAGFTGFAGTVRAFRIIGADGVARDCRPDAPGEAGELFRLGRLGLGVFGVLTELTMTAVPAFHLLADEHPEDFEALRREFPARVRAADHLEFYWFPGTDAALVKDNRRIPDAELAAWAASPEAAGVTRPTRLGRVRGFIDEELISNGALWAMCELARARPGLVPRLNALAARTVPRRRWVGPAHDVFVSPRRVRFAEMEYAVALDDAPEVLAEIRRVIDAAGAHVSFPLEVRAAAADDVALSTAYGRQSCYIAVHRYHREDHRDYFALVEPVLAAAGGRPHWGKLHTLGAAGLRERYPLFDEVARLRARLDPEGVFLNDHLRGLFGA